MRSPTPTPLGYPVVPTAEEDLVSTSRPKVIVGPLDLAGAEEVLAALEALTEVDQRSVRRRRKVTTTARAILTWLGAQPGEGWQARWEAGNPRDTTDWVAAISTTDRDSAKPDRYAVLDALGCLMLARAILPSYRFLRLLSSRILYKKTRATFRPDLFTRIEQRADQLQLRPVQRVQSINTLAMLVLHTGRDLDELTPDDFIDLRSVTGRSGGQTRGGISTAWDLARGLAQIPDAPFATMRLRGQLSTSEIVDSHQLTCGPIRDVIVRYLDERRPALDYSTFNNQAHVLASFWADLEAHHPGIDSLHLSTEVAHAWRQRVRTVVNRDGTVRERLSALNILVPVRAFYLDIAAWALEDPFWVPWAVPCPVRSSDTEGYMKNKRRTTARMHQRVRDRLPHLLRLVDSAETHLSAQAGLLGAGRNVLPGQSFQHDGLGYRRLEVADGQRGLIRRTGDEAVRLENCATGEQLDASLNEDEAFWTWAIIETLRHTGVRIEELLELTQLALVSHRLPETGEVIPLLQIVPSKTNQERLLVVTPELASVLASVISRLRSSDGTVPLVERHDIHERVWGSPLPHLFQRRRDYRSSVIKPGMVNKLLAAAWEQAGIRNAAGEPLKATAHDFRRMFATEMVTGGLPIHIAAKILGHNRLVTTQGYAAVFDEDLIRAYRTFLDARRAVRPAEEYREPTDAEWTEFQQHFQTRKLELGDCGRPYATPCHHEHACIRCPMLRVDPRARPRLATIITNLRDRISEARANGWLGEIQGLQISLDAAAGKLAALDRAERARPGRILLGMPGTN